MALFVLGDNDSSPANGNNSANNKNIFADLSGLLTTANEDAERNVNAAVTTTEAAVISLPRNDAVKPQHEKIYVDAFNIRNQLGKILKKVSQQAQNAPKTNVAASDPACQEKLERMEYLVFSLYKYFVEVNNAFRLDPDQQASKMKRLINEFYADKALKENLKILVPEGEMLPTPNAGPKPQNKQRNKPQNKQRNKPQNQQRNKPQNQQRNKKQNRNQRQNQQRNQRQNQQRNQRQNQQRNQRQNQRQNQPRNQKRNQQRNQKINNKGQNQPRNQQRNNKPNNRVNKKTGELGIVNSIQELIFG